MPTVYIGIGSNIDANNNIAACFTQLRNYWPDIVFSSLYQSEARDREDQADFVNAVARMDTGQTPQEIYAILTNIEQELGKNPPYDKGPRTIDLDLLLFENESYARCPTPHTLIIPHPRMHKRRFVLEPLSELIDPLQKHPVTHISWKELLISVSDQVCVKLQ